MLSPVSVPVPVGRKCISQVYSAVRSAWMHIRRAGKSEGVNVSTRGCVSVLQVQARDVSGFTAYLYEVCKLVSS